jgi:DNA ligase-1
MARAERANNATGIWQRNGACAVEYKLDGLRIQAHITKSQIPNPKSQINSKLQNSNIKLFSRGLEDVTSMYPDIVEGLSKQIKHNCIVEGEMIAVAEDGRFLPFQETSQRKRKYDIEEMAKKVPLKIYLFDLLMTDKTNMTYRTYGERREELEKLVKPGEIVKLMTKINVSSEEEIEDFFQKAIKDGTEGIIAKKLDGPYQAGARDFNWIKYKKSYQKSALSDTVDVVIMGYDEGQGKRSKFGIGDFLAGVYDPKTDRYLTVAKVGTGLTDEEWLRVASSLKPQITSSKPEEFQVSNQMSCDHWVNPKIVVEILADEITKSPMHTSDYALRFPRLVSFREKKPEDATSMKELEKMFKLQRTGGDLDGSKK